MQVPFSKYFKKNKLSQMKKELSRYWIKSYHLVFIICLLVALGGGIYFWYINVYTFRWSIEKKEEYKKQIQKIDLNEKKLKNILDEIENRKKVFDGTYEPMRDIFKPY